MENDAFIMEGKSENLKII